MTPRQFGSVLRSLGIAALSLSAHCLTAEAAEVAGNDLAAADVAVRQADAARAAAAAGVRSGAGAASVDAWMGFYGADAIVQLPNEPLANGKELVRRSAARLLGLPHFSVTWHPVNVALAASGELANVSAAYELRYADAHGAPKSDRGTVLEIWRKQTDGSWKCIVDSWSSDATSAPTATAATAPLPAAPPPPAPAAPPALATSPALAASPAVVAVAGSAALSRAVDPKYGAMPVHYEDAIRQHFQDHLKDPDSVRYEEIGIPEQGYTKGMTGNLLMHETRNYGWTVKATIDAKNSAGAYAGPASYTFLFRGEKILHILSPLTGDEIS